jgi:aspartyl-tRNA(Asn)/glutamyl-tRNA(Gln) amidotransferase subunit B
MAKEVFDGMYKTGADARQFAKTLGEQITDEDEIAEIVKGILEENSVQAEQYRAGKDKLFDFFVGQVMKKTRGKANPKLVGRILKRELAE